MFKRLLRKSFCVGYYQVMIKAIIFDCFGVFYADPVFAYMRKSSTSLDVATTLHELDKQAAQGVLDKPGFVGKAAELLNMPPVAVEEQFFKPHDQNQALIDFVVKLRGKYKTALLSNIGGDMMGSFFSPEDYERLFDVVVLSGNVGLSKPDSRIFQLTCKRLGVVPEDTLMVDDMPETIQAARMLGMLGICYKDFPQFLEDWVAIEG